MLSDHRSLDGTDQGGKIPTPNFFLTFIFYSTRSKESSSPQGSQSRQEGPRQESQEGRPQEAQAHQEVRPRQEGRPQEGMSRFLD